MSKTDQFAEGKQRAGAITLSAIMVIAGLALAPPTGAQSTCDATVAPADSVQDAIDDAADGDTICIEPGTYEGDLELDKNVDLVGTDAEDRAVIDGTLRNARDHLLLEDLTVRDVVIENDDGGLVEFARGGTTFDGVVFENVDFQLTGDNQDPDSVITREGDGSDLVVQGDGLTFRNVHMTSNGHAFEAGQGSFVWLQIDRGGPIVFEDVSFVGAETDLNLGTGSEDVTIRNATTSDGASMTLSDVTGLLVEDSTFEGVGITLNGVVDGVVRGNTFQGIEDAKVIDIRADFNAQNAENIRIEDNAFEGIDADAVEIFSTWGWVPSEDFQLTLRHNSFDVSGDRFAVFNTFDTFTVDAAENYWGHPTGPGGEGIGLGAQVSQGVDTFPWCFTEDCIVIGAV